MYWLRIGDQGDYESNDCLADIIDFLNELHVGEVTGWQEGGVGVGVETTTHYGYDFISLFVGDEDGNLIRPLNEDERAEMETGITKGEKIEP